MKFKLSGYRQCLKPKVHTGKLKSLHGTKIQTFEFDQRFQQAGEKIITSFIARHFFEKEHLHTKRMCQMAARKWLSCNHIFKLPASIGFWLNKRWVKLYDTSFIVLYEEGNVLGLKLCKRTKFSSIENVLHKTG